MIAPTDGLVRPKPFVNRPKQPADWDVSGRFPAACQYLAPDIPWRSFGREKRFVKACIRRLTPFSKSD
jgi:hypothetical protein